MRRAPPNNVQSFTTGLLGEMMIRPRMERTSAYQITETLDRAGDVLEVGAARTYQG